MAGGTKTVLQKKTAVTSANPTPSPHLVTPTNVSVLTILWGAVMRVSISMVALTNWKDRQLWNPHKSLVWTDLLATSVLLLKSLLPLRCGKPKAEVNFFFCSNLCSKLASKQLLTLMRSTGHCPPERVAKESSHSKKSVSTKYPSQLRLHGSRQPLSQFRISGREVHMTLSVGDQVCLQR